MKKLFVIIFALMSVCEMSAQYYNVGTSSTSTDYFGNTSTTHKDSYGHVTGTSTTSTDYFGNTTTTHKDSYGHVTGTSSTSTDYFGNSTTKQKSNDPNTIIWTW